MADTVARLVAFQAQVGPESAATIQRWLDEGVQHEADLVARLDAPDEGEAGTACWLLGQVGSKRAGPALVRALVGTRAGLWWPAGVALSLLSSRRSIAPLMRLIRIGTAGPQREAATYALGFMQVDADRRLAVVSTLIEALNDPGEVVGVRAHAAEGLAMQLGACAGMPDREAAHEAVDALCRALEAPEAELRFWAAFAIGSLRAPEALPALRRLAADDHRVVPGWWRVSEEAEDAITLIEGGTPPDRVPLPG